MMKKCISISIFICCALAAFATGHAPQIVANYLTDQWKEYMQAINRMNPDEKDSIKANLLTPGMYEKIGRMTGDTGADCIIRAQDVNDFGINDLKCRHLEGDWYEITYRWSEKDEPIQIPIRATTDAEGDIKVSYIAPECAGDKYGDKYLAVPKTKVVDNGTTKQFVETYYAAYTYPFLSISTDCEKQSRAVRDKYCTAQLCKRIDDWLANEAPEDIFDPFICGIDFDNICHWPVNVKEDGQNDFTVSFGNRSLKVFVAKTDGRWVISNITTNTR